MTLIKNLQSNAHKLNYLFPYLPILLPMCHDLLILALLTLYFFGEKIE
jgi:hypothetical protein